MFRHWWSSEAGWVHNRVHLLLAVISVVLLLGTQSVGAALLTLVVVGSLIVRIMAWDRARTRVLIPVRVTRSKRR